MKIEKLCEYLNEIGILQLDNINTFLKIFSQISKNKYKNVTDKLTMALFKYFTLISKTDQNLYDICRNIIDSYTNNQILQRYKGIKYLNIIFTSKLHSRYNLFFIKLIHFINSSKRNFVPKNNINGYNNNLNNIKKGKIVKKKKNDFDEINDIIEKLSFDKENKDNQYKFSSQPNYKSEYKPKNNVERKIKLNYNYDNYNYSPYMNINNIEKRNDENNKNITFKSNINYGYNNKINKEIDRLYDYYQNNNYDNQSNKPIRKKPKNKKYRSFTKIPNYMNNEYIIYQNPNAYQLLYDNYNYRYYPYYPYYVNDDYYDFYQKGQEHLRKVENKILQLKIQQFNEISDQCPFYPQISKYSPRTRSKSRSKSKNSNKSLNKCLTSINITDRNPLHINNINNLNLSQNKKEIKLKNLNRINVSSSMDTNNISKKTKNKNRSYSASKLKSNEKNYNLNINTNEKDENKENKENKNSKENKEIIEKRKDFDEKNKKYIEEKMKKNKEKEEEIKKNKEKEKLKKNGKKKINKNENIFDKLFQESKKKLIKEEKPKKKNIIDWEKRKKEHNRIYPEDDIKNRRKKKNSKPKNNNPPKGEKVLDFGAFSQIDKDKNGDNKKDEDKKEGEIEDKKNYNIVVDSKSKEEENNINNNGNANNNDGNKNMPMLQDLIINSDKSESENPELAISKNTNLPKNEEEKKEDPKQSVNLLSSDISLSLNLEERRKQMEEMGHLPNMGGLRSEAIQKLFENN